MGLAQVKMSYFQYKHFNSDDLDKPEKANPYWYFQNIISSS